MPRPSRERAGKAASLAPKPLAAAFSGTRVWGDCGATALSMKGIRVMAGLLCDALCGQALAAIVRQRRHAL
jgi:hypothetical protein